MVSATTVQSFATEASPRRPMTGIVPQIDPQYLTTVPSRSASPTSLLSGRVGSPSVSASSTDTVATSTSLPDLDTTAAIVPVLSYPPPASRVRSTNNHSSQDTNDSTIVCWDGVFVQRQRSDSPSPWTWPQMNLRKNVDREILERVRAPRRSHGDQSLEMEYCLELLFAGKEKDRLYPAIVISTRSRKTKGRISQYLVQSKIRPALAENNLDMFVLKTDISLAALWNSRPQELDHLSGRLVLPHGTSILCGAKILVSSSSSPVTSCVLGGFLDIGGALYGHTVLHPFIQGYDSSDDEGDDSDSDCNDPNENEPFCLLLDREQGPPHHSPPSASSCSSINNAQSRPASTHSIKVGKTVDLLDDEAFDTSQSERFWTSYEGYDADWAIFVPPRTLISMPDVDICTDNIIGGFAITEAFTEAFDVSVPVTVRLPAGEVGGQLQPGSVLYRLGTELLVLQLVTLDHPLQSGCSGAWVTFGNGLCGSIIVTRESDPWVYIMPFTTIQEDMQKVCRSAVQLPPVSASTSHATAQAGAGMPTTIVAGSANDALPPLTRATSLTSVKSSADTDIASSLLGDGYYLELHDGTLEVPFRYQEDADLLCPFQILDCDQIFTDIVSFKRHVFSHFRGYELPSTAACFLCDNKYVQRPEDYSALAWNSMLSHMAHDHYRRGQNLATVRTDFYLMRWMFSKRLISEEQFSRTQLIPVPIHLPRRFVPASTTFQQPTTVISQVTVTATPPTRSLESLVEHSAIATMRLS